MISIIKKSVVKVRVPMRPNFIHVNDSPVAIAEISDDILKAIGREWTRELLALAKKRRGKKHDAR